MNTTPSSFDACIIWLPLPPLHIDIHARTTIATANYTPWVQVRAVAALVVARHQFRQWDPATEHGRKLLLVSPVIGVACSSICLPSTSPSRLYTNFVTVALSLSLSLCVCVWTKYLR